MSDFTDIQKRSLLLKQNECCKRKEIHKHTSLKYDKFDKLTGLPQVALSAFLSSLSVSNYSETSKSLSITIAIFSSVLTILSASTRYFEFGKLKESHKKSSISYGKLERFIELELMKNNKKSFDDLLETIVQEYNNIRETSYMIPSPENEKRCEV